MPRLSLDKKYRLSYGCTKCQRRHYQGTKIYTEHMKFQSKEGLERGK